MSSLAATLYAAWRSEQDTSIVPAWGNLDTEQRAAWERVAACAEDELAPLPVGKVPVDLTEAQRASLAALQYASSSGPFAPPGARIVMCPEPAEPQLVVDVHYTNSAVVDAVREGERTFGKELNLELIEQLTQERDDATASRDAARKSLDSIRDWLDATGRTGDGTISARAIEALVHLSAQLDEALRAVRDGFPATVAVIRLQRDEAQAELERLKAYVRNPPLSIADAASLMPGEMAALMIDSRCTACGHLAVLHYADSRPADGCDVDGCACKGGTYAHARSGT